MACHSVTGSMGFLRVLWSLEGGIGGLGEGLGVVWVVAWWVMEGDLVAKGSQ